MLLDDLLKLTEPSYTKKVINDINPISKRVKRRIVYKPNDSMRQVHEIIKKLIKTALKYGFIQTPSAAGWGTGNSPKKNLLKHKVGKVFPRYWFATDISNAFDSVVISGMTASMLLLLPKADVFIIWNFLKKFCMHGEKGLVQGLPASPYLFNLYAEFCMDMQLRLYSSRYDLTYTRLGDDLLFSSQKPITRATRALILDVVRQNFPVNYRKTQVFDLVKDKSIQLNGIGIRNRKFSKKIDKRKVKNLWHEVDYHYALEEGELFVPGHYKRKLKGLIHSAMYDKTVDPSVIHGHMGIFFSLTGYYKSKLDWKILDLYLRFNLMSKMV